MAADPFIDTQDLTDYLGRSMVADPGAIIAVDAACDFCRSVSEQTFNKVSNETITLDGTGTDVLVLPQLPVTKVSTVTVGEDAAENWVLGSNGTLLKTSGVWTKGRRNVSVKYDHGYTEVPTDVRMVALALASRLVLQGPALQETNGDVSVRYAVAATDLTSTEKLILTKYRGR